MLGNSIVLKIRFRNTGGRRRLLTFCSLVLGFILLIRPFRQDLSSWLSNRVISYEQVGLTKDIDGRNDSDSSLLWNSSNNDNAPTKTALEPRNSLIRPSNNATTQTPKKKKKKRNGKRRKPPDDLPSNGKIPFFKFWNYTTNSIQLPSPPSSEGGLTSFEILQEVLKDNDVGDIQENAALPACLIPNIHGTEALVDAVLGGNEPLSRPILNIGMPKAGSSTLADFFSCGGMRIDHNQLGMCMMKAASEGFPPIRACHGGFDAYLQMDSNAPPCFFPQVSLLDELHEEYPNATFVISFRPVDDWIKSAKNWHGMFSRWSKCTIPGLLHSKGESLTKQQVRNWWCGHVKHVREFVRQHPSHKLIELELYDTPGSSIMMSKLFGVNALCWGKSNANQRLEKQKDNDEK